MAVFITFALAHSPLNSAKLSCSSEATLHIEGLYFTPQIKEGSSHILLVYRIDLKTLVWCAFYG